jgi:hypothetical protein
VRYSPTSTICRRKPSAKATPNERYHDSVMFGVEIARDDLAKIVGDEK